MITDLKREAAKNKKVGGGVAETPRIKLAGLLSS